MEEFSEEDLLIEEEQDEKTVSMNYDIASYPSDFTLAGIVQMWKDRDIVIPDYQREFVWSINQASLLIDSFLCGLPVPPVFFYIDDENKNLVIDGQQRILSVSFFFSGFFGEESSQGKRKVFRLSGLDSSIPYSNKTFEDLDETLQRKLKQAVLRAVNIRQLNPVGESTSAYHIFERLNTGGTPLKPQEIRNCVFRGELNKSFKKLNKDVNWRKILGKPNIDKHQKDIELILRVFSLVGSADQYEKPMKEFLNNAMLKHDKGDTKKAINFFATFEKVTAIIVNSIGEKPFHLRGPLNLAALDSVMSVLIENYKKVDPLTLKDRYTKLTDDEDFKEHTKFSTTDSKAVTERIRKVKKIMLG
ncbi:MAG: DUF262 domain-containing protein [Ferrovum sp.]|nr:DUF262 domain-containing protein [Ferrovum sp.]